MSTTTVLEESVLAETPPAGDLGGLEDSRYEIIDGQRRELPPMGIYSVTIASRLVRKMGGFTDAHGLGEVVTEALFRLPLEGDAHRNRRPDVAFVSYQRWPADRPLPGEANAWDVVPDLAVEVISPNDLAEEQLGKVHDYFGAGVRLVWVVYPRQRQVYVHESTTSVRILTESESLDGGAVLSGWTLPLKTLFGPPPAPAST